MSIPRAITGVSKADSSLSRVSQPPIALSVPIDVPIASATALSFIDKINDTDLKYTFFEDDLMTFTDFQSEIGFYRASVRLGCYKGEECIAVEARSEGTIDGVPCLTEISACLDKSLRTLRQELHELVRLQQGALERRTVTELESQGYRVKRDVRQGGTMDSLERVFDRAIMSGFVSEAANIVLQRILVTKGLPDYFDALSFDADANLCLSTYKDLSLTKIHVGPENTPVRCYGIERRLHCVTDVPVGWHTYFLSDGHLISRAQVGSPILMKVRVVPDLMQHDEFLPVPVFERAPLDWREDLQLTRIFQDRKEALASANRLYMRSHPELQALIADFLQSLLAHKPVNTLQFAHEFFSTFSNRFMTIGESTHLHSNRPGLLLSDQSM